ncbi:MAG: hypothetical protein ACTSO9_16445 [Candidatus Helarchaeota archaeon]
MKKNYSKTFNFNFTRVFGPITEEALLLGFSIFMIIIIISMVFGIFQWLGSSIIAFFNQLGLG